MSYYNHLICKDDVSIECGLSHSEITINAGSTQRKLSNLIKDFPDNCYVNKQITGCGGTTLVLRNNIDYVVLVPYINLLLSKQADNSNIVDLVTIYSNGDSYSDISKYISNKNRPRKILCTFDSLSKLLNIEGFNPKEFKVLVDEAHTLVNLGSFKAQTCENVLRNYLLFKSHVFLTATPTKREYLPNQLKSVPLCTINWSDAKAVKFNLQKIDTGLNNALFGLCLDYLLDKCKGNAHIFYNSVTELSNVLNKLKNLQHGIKGKLYIDPSDIRVVCSTTRANQKTFNSKLGIAWGKISNINDPVARINFYTSTAFEGADILDEEGHTYIIINGARDSTKVDFHVLVPQICGRIRNTKYNEYINLLVGNIPEAATLTKDQWIHTVKSRINDSTDRLKFIQNKDVNTPEVILKDAIKNAEADKYTFRDENGNLYVSDVALKAELQSYEALEATYVVREVKGAELNCAGYSGSFKELITNVDKQSPFAHKPTGIVKLLNDSMQCFSNALKEYCEARDENNEKACGLIELKDDYYKMLYDTLGHANLKALEYRKSSIIKAYKTQEDTYDKRTLIVSKLNLNNNDVILRVDAKTKLQNIYNELGISDKAKATDIEKWYDISLTKINGKHAIKIIKLRQ